MEPRVDTLLASQPSLIEPPAHALVAVVENATALARAELRLAAAEGKSWLGKAGLGLALIALSLLLLQVFVLLLALTPLLLRDYSVGAIAAMLALSLLPALGAAGLARRELRPKQRE